MQCNCGFDFARARIRQLKGGRPRFKSYAVIDDGDYIELVNRAIAVTKAKTERTRMTALGKSAELVGTLMRCPKCGSYTMLTPKTSRRIHLAPQKRGNPRKAASK